NTTRKSPMSITPSRSGLPAPVPRVARPPTVDLIAIELRSPIFSGALAVGSQLGEADSAAHRGGSRAPLREATQRRVRGGRLTALPGRGLRESAVDADDIRVLSRARLAGEGGPRRVRAAGSAVSAPHVLGDPLAGLLEAR